MNQTGYGQDNAKAVFNRRHFLYVDYQRVIYAFSPV